jgi:uncharacterized protein GlcG (DUF336 family)
MKKQIITACILCLTSFAVSSQPPQTLNSSASARVPAAYGPSLELSIEAAQVAIAACAKEGGQTIGVSLIDSAGVLKVLLAADGTSPRGVSSSTAKALTALQYKTTTKDLFERIPTDKKLADEIAANTALNGRPGGILITKGGKIVGAIGVGGGRTDHECALAGLKQIQDRIK